MSRINTIQQAIKQLDGGEYQKLMDAYLYKKFKYPNIEALGSHTGTNKVTKGIPDSYVKLDNGKYVLIMYGSVESTSYEKIEKDIKSCLDTKKVDIDVKEIDEIICCYTSTNIHIEQKKKLENMIKGVKITLVGISSVSHDLLLNYPTIAADHLGIPVDTEQIFEIDDFIEKYDKNKMNASINMDLLNRDNEIKSLINKLEESKVVLIFGKSGVGKTRLALEVARIYRDKYDFHVLCIKDNGQILYNDLKYHLSDRGEYLIFVDDANQITKLEHVLDYIVTPPKGVNVKIIMTVRDYAKDKVKQIVCNKVIPKEEVVDILKDEEIKEILSRNLDVKNDMYLDRIVMISKGNARLAVLAAKLALNNGLTSIHNSIDIFKYYYGGIIEKEFFDTDKIIVTFVITLLGPFQYKSNEMAVKILRDNGIEEDKLNKLCYELNNSEIIDLYMDKVVKITDQSMGDYLLYYILIEKKYIVLADIVKDLFEKYRDKLVYALSTILTLFNSKECLDYIKNQINKVWSTIEDEYDKFEYVKTFYMINEEKSLAFIKNKIDKMEKEEILLDSDGTVLKNKNDNSIKCEIIKIFSGLKYSNNYELMLELSMYYFRRKPSKILDFYLLFSDRLGYDQNSFRFEYKKELLIIEYLWKEANKGLNINLTILLLNVIEKFIEFESNIFENYGDKKVRVITVNLCMCNGLKKLREKLWSILGELYEKERYKKIINNILLDYNPYQLKDEEQLKLIYEVDFKFINENIFNRIISPDFTQSKIFKHFSKINKRLKISADTIVEEYKKNKEFLMYNTLVEDYDNTDWEIEQQRRKDNIYNMVKDYKEDDFIKLFNLCNRVLNESKSREQWKLENAITFLFNGIKENVEKYTSSIKAYLKCNTPFSSCIKDKVATLIKVIGSRETKKIIFNYEYKQKNIWVYEFLFCIPAEERDINYSDLLRETFEDEINKEQPTVPSIKCIALYKDIDKDIVLDISLKLLKVNSPEKSYLIKSFLGYSLDKGSSEEIFNIFDERINILESLYLSINKGDIDYEGNLFINLIRNNVDFLKKFVQQMININNKDYYIEKFEVLWEQENYNDLIKIAFDTIVESKDDIGLWSCENNIRSIFMCNTSSVIENKKVEWIKNYIKTVLNNSDYLNLIFQVVMYTLKTHTKEIILYFLDINKNIEMFKSISLFPRFKLWAGSEVIIIEKEIDFLNELIHGINGIEYIEHKEYLKEFILSKEIYKQQILVNEYLEDR